MIVFRVAHEDEVVDGDDAPDATVTDACGKFARESMIDLHTVTLQLRDYAATAPVTLSQEKVTFRIAEGKVWTILHLEAHIIVAGIGSIETQL
jgi:hypothetical protein